MSFFSDVGEIILDRPGLPFVRRALRELAHAVRAQVKEGQAAQRLRPILPHGLRAKAHLVIFKLADELCDGPVARDPGLLPLARARVVEIEALPRPPGRPGPVLEDDAAVDYVLNAVGPGELA